MNDRAVVSCPRCIRQFEVDASIDRIVGQCGVCKAYFVIVIPKLTGPVEDALVLEKEMEPRYFYFQEACENLARNASDLMTLVSRHVAVEDVMAIAKSLPKSRDDLTNEEWRRGTLSRALGVAHDRALTEQEMRRHSQLCEYFLDCLPRRAPHAVDMLQAAFAGVLGGIDWTEAGQERIVVLNTPPKTKDRWWWKKA